MVLMTGLRKRCLVTHGASLTQVGLGFVGSEAHSIALPCGRA